MPRLPRSLHPVLRHVLRLVALLACVGQVGMVVAPYMDAHAGENMVVHVESHGSPLHHAHNPDLCPACAALALVGPPESGRIPLPEAYVRQIQPATVVARPAHYVFARAARPRAPPMWVSESRAPRSSPSGTLIPIIHASRTMAVRAPAERGGQRARAAT
jgi:hypothetical protein